jgi:hypothetical protein
MRVVKLSALAILISANIAGVIAIKPVKNERRIVDPRAGQPATRLAFPSGGRRAIRANA